MKNYHKDHPSMSCEIIKELIQTEEKDFRVKNVNLSGEIVKHTTHIQFVLVKKSRQIS